MQAFYDSKPPYLEAVGNGSYVYRFNIEEVVPELTDENAGEEKASQWKCEEVTIWKPVTSDKVIEAVIRAKYTASAELALVNKFNAYQQGLDVEAGIVEEYTEYLSFVANVKRQVRKDLGEETSVTPKTATALTPRIADIAKLLTLTVNTMSLTDSDALAVKSVYPDWGTLIGKTVKKDEKMQYDGKLWKVLQEHTVQEQWKPGTGTESLYTEIVESAAGTEDDPIPYDNNMELEQGKYYSQDGEVYLCTRDTEIPVYNPLKDLVGIYVELVE
jgi:hypothetical protein